MNKVNWTEPTETSSALTLQHNAPRNRLEFRFDITLFGVFQVGTIESLDPPHIILSNVSLSGVRGVGMHQSLWVPGVPQTQSVTNLMSSHLDQVIQPDPWEMKQSQRSKTGPGLFWQLDSDYLIVKGGNCAQGSTDFKSVWTSEP